MKLREYAMTDDLYSVYDESDHTQFKHIFRPNAISGRNSATHIINGNEFIFPKMTWQLLDQTKTCLYTAWEKI